jgi:hypothetical protein
MLMYPLENIVVYIIWSNCVNFHEFMHGNESRTDEKVKKTYLKSSL